MEESGNSSSEVQSLQMEIQDNQSRIEQLLAFVEDLRDRVTTLESYHP